MTFEPKLIHLPEPMLTFGHGQMLEHPKDGLFLFGPLEEKKPAEIRVGAIGTIHGLGRLRRWLMATRNYIPPYDATKPFHAGFPGFEAAFRTSWPTEPVAEISLSGDKIGHALRLSNRHDAIYQTVDIFAEKLLSYRREQEVEPAFWFVVIPEEVYKFGRPQVRPPKAEQSASKLLLSAKQARNILIEGSLFSRDREAADIYRFEVNFHNQLKARLLQEKIVVQIVRETTLTPDDFVTNGRPVRRVEDPATIAWKLCTTAFFKGGGKPWKIANVRSGVCYVGLAFKQDSTAPRADGFANACCGAQMFLDSGDGLVFRGHVGPWHSEKTGDFHLNYQEARELISSVVTSYKAPVGEPPRQPPTELFIHGRTRFSDEEWSGFRAAVPQGTKVVGVRIRRSDDVKLFRPGKHPVIRGSALMLTERLGYLWTNGFVPRLGTYTGWEVPRPLSIEVCRGEAELTQVVADIMALTKVNFNSCIFADGSPVTLRFADAVGEILTAAPILDLPPLPFRHYI
jgi:hypothetical protein